MSHGVLATARLLALASAPPSSFGFGGAPSGWSMTLKALLPVLGYAVALPALWWLFRRTWHEQDAEAAEHRAALKADGHGDHRPLALCAIAAIVLTMQEYYGGRSFYYAVLRPWMLDLEAAAVTGQGRIGRWLDIGRWGELYAFGWWTLTRVVGYVVVPLAAWKLLFRKDRVLDLAGLRARGLLGHLWIYGACLLLVVPLVFLVSRSPDFAAYYPFYKLCSRSWFDLVSWELMYVAQFFALEIFFRGFWVQGLRRVLGSGAVFVMCVPYVMIHYGKPYLEAGGAFIAGVALGSLAMRTKSIYSGFLVHVTVALLMDLLGLLQGGGLPKTWWPT